MSLSTMTTTSLSYRLSPVFGGSGDAAKGVADERGVIMMMPWGRHRVKNVSPGGAYTPSSARGTRRNGASSSSSSSSSSRGSSREGAARCELLDWSSCKKGRGGRRRGEEGTATTSRRQQQQRQHGLYLPGQPRLYLPRRPADDGKMIASSPRSNATTTTTSTKTTTLSRRGLLAASGAAFASAAVDLARPQPSSAFIDLPSRLHNRYFLVRHGESTLDTRRIILSNPSFKYDTTYGLTRRGVEQMHAAAAVIQDVYDGAPSWLYTSNFQRSFQSALIIRQDLGMLFSQLRTEFSGLLAPSLPDPRKMGALDFGSAASLPAVWEGDSKDATNTPPPVAASLQPSASVESPRDLYRRALECFTRLEATYYGEDIILVSHADTLSLFTAAVMGTDLRSHHADWALELGQVRCVDLSGAPVNDNFSPTDLRGEYAVGDKAVNYRAGGAGRTEDVQGDLSS